MTQQSRIWMGVIIAIVLLALGFLVYNNMRRKWRCTESGCEQVFGGDYSTHEKCVSACAKKKSLKTVTFADQEAAYACTSEYKCIEADEGDYSSMEACEKNCQKPTTYYAPSYYPQSLYYGRPYYWGYGGHGRRRGRRRHRRRA